MLCNRHSDQECFHLILCSRPFDDVTNLCLCVCTQGGGGGGGVDVDTCGENKYRKVDISVVFSMAYSKIILKSGKHHLGRNSQRHPV